MKQIQNASLTTDFPITAPIRDGNGAAYRLLTQFRTRVQHLWKDRGELLKTAAAACTISLSVLLISYLFFVQLAAHGW